MFACRRIAFAVRCTFAATLRDIDDYCRVGFIRVNGKTGTKMNLLVVLIDCVRLVCAFHHDIGIVLANPDAKYA